MAASGLLAAGGCTDTEFINRPFNPPVAAANGYLGYFTVADQQTTCGNCHTGKQRDWKGTAHAGAYQTLASNANAQEFCYNCHTVGKNGSPAGVVGGWAATKDSIYRDVQCENCHGPGLTHVENPDASQPLASILADTATTGTCGDCHEGSHHPFAEQWAESRHGTVPAQAASASTTSRESCMVCHEGGTALRVKFGENDDYIEKGQGPLSITCAVCHDPHGSPYEAQLRAPLDAGAGLNNLCVTCHARRGTPPSSHGPHASQGLLVLGENVGWIPPGFVYDTNLVSTSHGTSANEKLCATCHVAKFTVTDKVTGNFSFQAVGHTFEAIPCKDPVTGEPTKGPCASTQREFSGCTTGNCHLGPGNEGAVRTAYDNLVILINSFLDDLWEDLNNDSVMDPFPTDRGVLPKVLAANPTDTTILDVRDRTVTVAEGALWNAQLSYTSSRAHFGDGTVYKGLANGGKGVHFGAHKGSGNGVHNSFLIKALLIASIDAVEAQYGVSATAPAQLRREAVRAALPPILTKTPR